MDLISVIIPIYKVEQYLRKCVESVINQTYRELEIILVDDGSPDCCGEICDEFEKTDSRIKVIHQANMGLSGARNAALDIMRGDAVTFVDGDDSIDPHMIEYLVDDMERYHADIVECQFYDVYTGSVCSKSYLNETNVYTRDEALLIDLSSKGGRVSACGKLYSKIIFREHRFEVGRIVEDAFAIIGSIRQADKIVIDHRPMYYYYHRNDSITTKEYNERTFDLIVAANRNLEIVKKEFPRALPGALFRYDWSYLWVLDRILLSHDWRENEHFREVLEHVRRHLFRILRCPYFTANRKRGTLVVVASPAIYRKIVQRTWHKRWN